MNVRDASTNSSKRQPELRSVAVVGGREKQPTVVLPPIVQTIRLQSRKKLIELLQLLFSNTDDALFELADRATTDQQQEMYFDSMRSIRLHRKTIGKRFLEHFVASFEEAYKARSEVCESDQDDDLEADNYSLLDQEELEMTVAVAGIVAKVTSQYSLPLMHLTKRLDSLCKSHTIHERDNPLGPQVLSTCFAQSLADLDLNIKVRIILMKLFERFVMEQLADLFESTNRALIDAGVLPDLKKQMARVKKQPVQATANDNQTEADGTGTSLTAGGTAQPAGDGGVSFQAVQQLLSTVRSSTSASVALPGPAIESDEVISALSHIQANHSAGAINPHEIPAKIDLQALIRGNLIGAQAKPLHQTDDDTVNFVGMLFDYILNDRNLAIPMKALIGRLQIPIVKLAILDKSFFERAAHPARLLLNELSSAGIGWSNSAELKRDALYNTIEAVVNRILDEFTDNPVLFDTQLQELRDFVAKDNRRSILVEQRVREAENGKARTKSAKLTVQNLINQKASGLRVPPAVGKFISDIWSKVLTLQCVRRGEDSTEWQTTVELLDSLLWALQPLTTAELIAEREARIEDISEGIQEQVAALGMSEDEPLKFCTWLVNHIECLNEEDRAFLETDDDRPETEGIEPIGEIILTEVDRQEPEHHMDTMFLKGLKNLTEGAWVEVSEEDSEVIRCKLATISQPGDLFVFVNRRGMKVLERTRLQLAHLLRNKRLKSIDESQVFDRALQNVIGNLRQMQRRQDT